MPGGEDDAVSGIFTYDGTFATNAQNSHVTAEAESFSAKVAAENKKVAEEFGLPLGNYGFGGPQSNGDSTSVGGSLPTNDVASTFSGVYAMSEMDDNSFLRNVSADVILDAQERGQESNPGDVSYIESMIESKAEEKSGNIGELIGGYAVTRAPSPPQEINTTPQGGQGTLFDSFMRTMVNLGLVWQTSGTAPSSPQATDRTSSPAGSQDQGDDRSVSMLSFEGREVTSMTNASRASKIPFFKGKILERKYPGEEISCTGRRTTGEPRQASILYSFSTHLSLQLRGFACAAHRRWWVYHFLSGE